MKESVLILRNSLVIWPGLISRSVISTLREDIPSPEEKAGNEERLELLFPLLLPGKSSVDV